MRQAIRLGRVAGIRLGLNGGALVIVVLLAAGLAFGRLPAIYPGHNAALYFAAGLVAAALFLASILVHELAHALVARANGVQVDAITLWLLGGVAARRRPGAAGRRVAVHRRPYEGFRGGRAGRPHLRVRAHRGRGVPGPHARRRAFRPVVGAAGLVPGPGRHRRGGARQARPPAARGPGGRHDVRAPDHRRTERDDERLHLHRRVAAPAFDVPVGRHGRPADRAG